MGTDEFYIGKQDTLYYKRENGSLSRFGLRFTPDGIRVFDHLLRRWYDLPLEIPILGGGTVILEVKVVDD